MDKFNGSYAEFLQSGYWQDVRYQKLELNPRCERCNSTYRIQVHHKLYRGSWYDVQLDDLETLCRECHRKEHGKGPSMNEVGRARSNKRKIAKIIRQLRGHKRRKKKKWKDQSLEPRRLRELRSGNFIAKDGRLLYSPII